MIKQKQTYQQFLCTHMVGFCKPGHIITTLALINTLNVWFGTLLLLWSSILYNQIAKYEFCCFIF